jgi:hypothetical protein
VFLSVTVKVDSHCLSLGSAQRCAGFDVTSSAEDRPYMD